MKRSSSLSLNDPLVRILKLVSTLGRGGGVGLSLNDPLVRILKHVPGADMTFGGPCCH